MSPRTHRSDVSPSEAAPRIECRVWERQPCELQTYCQPIVARADNDVTWPATVRDISQGGIGLVAARRFEPKAVLAVEFPGADTSPADVLFARVVHATALDGGYWLLGCAFVSELSEFELQSLLHRALPEHAPSARTGGTSLERVTLHSLGAGQPPAPGRKQSGRTFVLPEVTVQGPPRDGTAASVLVRRLYVTGTWPLPAGSPVTGWIGNKAQRPPDFKWTINRCDQQGERWTLSYAFVDTPSPEVSWELGYAGLDQDTPA
jgi:hypothetical protein